MINVKLDDDEGIILQQAGVEYYTIGDEGDAVAVLTDKKVELLGYDEETIIDIFLNDIRVIDGEIQVKEIEDSEYGRCIRILTRTMGIYIQFPGNSNKMTPIYAEWVEKIIKATVKIQGLSLADIKFPAPNEASEDIVPTNKIKSIPFMESVVKSIKKNLVKVKKEKTDISQPQATKEVQSEMKTERADVALSPPVIAYCSYCGEEINVKVKFCPSCGKPTDKNAANLQERMHEGRQKYAGRIIKCPNCGEQLSALSVRCTTCGYELRGIDASESVNVFVSKMTQMKNIEDKVALIRNFPVPNTKEDIFEFMILAASNIKSESKGIVCDAWVAKFEQSYQKACVMFKGEPDFQKIEGIYDETINQVKKIQASRTVRKTVGGFIDMMPSRAFFIALVFFIILNIAHVIHGSFEIGYISASALFLWIIYLISTRKKRKMKKLEEKNKMKIKKIEEKNKIKNAKKGMRVD